MFNKALTLVLAGILFMGVITVTYGTLYDKGFVASIAGIAGFGDGAHEGRNGGHHDD